MPVRLTWLAVRRYGTDTAVGLVSRGIQRTARYAGAPQKYHVTVSRAWVELVGYHAGASDDGDFDGFVAQHHGRCAIRLGRAGPAATASTRPATPPIPATAMTTAVTTPMGAQRRSASAGSIRVARAAG